MSPRPNLTQRLEKLTKGDLYMCVRALDHNTPLTELFFGRNIIRDLILRLFNNRRSGNTLKHQSIPRDTGSPALVSVIIPVLNEADNIVDVIQHALSDPITGEVIVVDDSSTDNTVLLAKHAGARVIMSSMLGKGASMHDGALAARFDILAYLDGDLAGLRQNTISALAEPILRNGTDFVKASFGRGGGRVTELTAKPMLKLFFPELSEFSQPLGGIIAGRKNLLQQLQFENDYGVDVGLLIDAHLAGAKIAQVEIGSLEHDSQSLHNLGFMAQEVSRVILERAKSVGRLHASQIMSVFELERRNKADIDYVLCKLQGCTRLVLLDMDGTVSLQRYVVELAKATGRLEQLEQLLDGEDLDASTRSEQIAALFRFVHKSQFEQIARGIEIRDGVIEAVNMWRRNGYVVGIISDSYFVAAEIIRRRIFADFALAHSLAFDLGICQGTLHINRAFSHVNGCAEHSHCKSNVLRYITDQEPALKDEGVVVVGDNINDICLLNMAHRAFTIEPKHPGLKQAQITEIAHFSDAVLDLGLS